MSNGHILMSDPLHPALIPMMLFAHEEGLKVEWEASDLDGGTWLFLVGCVEIVPKGIRNLYDHVLVLHASDLPRGRGWSPWIHAIREGAEEICITLLEAEDKVDAGKIWNQAWVKIDSNMLYNEIAETMAIWCVELMRMAMQGECTEPQEQQGKPTYCRRLTEEDSHFPITRKQFNMLRTCDPLRFAPWFEMDGKRYAIDLYLMEDLQED